MFDVFSIYFCTTALKFCALLLLTLLQIVLRHVIWLLVVQWLHLSLSSVKKDKQAVGMKAVEINWDKDECQKPKKGKLKERQELLTEAQRQSADPV